MSFFGGDAITDLNVKVQNYAWVVGIVVLALVFMVWQHHDMIQQHQVDLKTLSNGTGVLISQTTGKKPEGMADVGYAKRLGQCRTDGTANDSNDACWGEDFLYPQQTVKSGFLGGNEPPVFYDIGDVRATRSGNALNASDRADANASADVANAANLLSQAMNMKVSSTNSQASIDAARSAAAARLTAAEARLAQLRAASEGMVAYPGREPMGNPERDLMAGFY